MTNSVQKILESKPALKQWSEVTMDLRAAHHAALAQVDAVIDERLANKSLGRKLDVLHSILRGEHGAHPAMGAIWPAMQDAALARLNALAYQLMVEEMEKQKEGV